MSTTPCGSDCCTDEDCCVQECDEGKSCERHEREAAAYWSAYFGKGVQHMGPPASDEQMAEWKRLK